MERSNDQLIQDGDDLRKQLICSECKGQYKDPRTLNCGHSFCMECIDKLHHVNNYPVVCPRCRHKTALPNDKAGNLDIDPSLENLLELQRKIDHPKREMCQKHKDKELQAYCKICQLVTCWRCAHENHKTHRVIEVKEWYPEVKREITSELTNVEERIDEFKGMIVAINANQADMEKVKEDVSDEISKTAREVIEKVQQEEKELLEQVERVAQHKMRMLEKQKKDAQSKVDRLEVSKQIVNLTISKESKQAVIRNKPKLLDHTKIVKECKFDPKRYQPETPENFFAFHRRRGDLAFGYITLKPLECIQDVNKPYGISIWENRDLVVTQRTDNDSIVLVECQGRGQTMLEKTGKKKMDLKLKSPHAVAATADGQHVWICSQDKVQKLQIRGRQLTQVDKYDDIKEPQGIAISEETGKVFIIDSAGKTFSVLPENIKYELQQPVQSPKGITFDREGNLCILDKNCVKKFTQQGEFMGQFGSKSGDLGSEAGQLNGASCIARDENGLVYVTEERNHRVCVFNEDGGFLCWFGGCGSQEGEFRNPNGIAVDGHGHLYVCDTMNDRIVVYGIL